MPREDNLKTSLWGDFERTSADIFSPREGVKLAHPISLYQIVSKQGDIYFTIHLVLPEERIAYNQGLITVGNLSEFGPNASRLQGATGSPTRFEVTSADSGFMIVDHQDDASAPPIATSEEHVGLIVRGQARDLTERPTLLFAGTSPLGILAGTLWATQNELANVPAPPGFPGSPIEALVRLLPPGSALPALSDIESVRVICGATEYDPISREWKEAVRRTPIQVLTEGGTARVIFVGDHRIEMKETDLPRLLLFLIKRSQQEEWTTIAQAQKHIDRQVNPNRYGTLESRISGIKHHSSDPNFVQTTQEDGKPAYRLRADIVFIEEGVAPR